MKHFDLHILYANVNSNLVSNPMRSIKSIIWCCIVRIALVAISVNIQHTKMCELLVHDWEKPCRQNWWLVRILLVEQWSFSGRYPSTWPIKTEEHQTAVLWYSCRSSVMWTSKKLYQRPSDEVAFSDVHVWSYPL